MMSSRTQVFSSFHFVIFIIWGLSSGLSPCIMRCLQQRQALNTQRAVTRSKILKGEERCFPSLYEVRKLFQYHIGTPPLILIGQNSITVLSARPMVSKFGPAIVNNKAHSLRLQIKAAPSLTAKDISLIKFGLCYARIRECPWEEKPLADISRGRRVRGWFFPGDSSQNYIPQIPVFSSSSETRSGMIL